LISDIRTIVSKWFRFTSTDKRKTRFLFNKNTVARHFGEATVQIYNFLIIIHHSAARGGGTSNVNPNTLQSEAPKPLCTINE
jgi:hypothetical protein